MGAGYLEARFETGTPNYESGTGPYSSKQIYMPLISFQPTLAPSHLLRDDELRGVDEPLAALPEMKAPTWSLETRAYPDTIGFLMTLCLGTPTTTAGNGTITDLMGGTIPTGAYRHTWTAPFRQGVYPYSATMRVAYADQSTYFTLRGAVCDTLSISSPEAGGVRIAASGPALSMENVASHGLSASYEALSVPPFLRSHLTVPGWLSSSQAFEDFSVQIANPVEVVRSLGVASQYPDLVERAGAPTTVTGAAPKRQLGTVDFQALRDATGFPGTARWLSTANVGTTSYAYRMIAAYDNLQYTEGGPQALTNQRRIGQDLSFRASYDGSGASATFQVVNATSSYA